ncbi:MAG TPA: hypothetical protein VHQ42_06515 [Candidatus Limnocylindria bacterium]|nr:hypothetical protein [Candidatus Limnocylindria bacterium]
MDWLQFGAQWLHVLLGILWFGNALVLAVITIPALNRLPITTQREFSQSVGHIASRLFTIVAPAVIVLGIIRGTFLGPIKDLDDLFGTAYGITWLVALVAATATFLWGKLMIEGALLAVNTAPLSADGGPTPELTRAVERVKLMTILELVGFFVVFTCMILMRFGA